jgi:translation initiation factor eIF-2B subunit beta
MAMACKAHHVPLIVVGGIYKLTPKISFDQDTYNDLLNPGEFVKFGNGDYPENIEVIIPGLDYIEPEFVTLYITNEGEHTPAYIYRVFTELYLSNQ